jgi:hypothetical protein
MSVAIDAMISLIGVVGRGVKATVYTDGVVRKWVRYCAVLETYQYI